MNRRHALLRLRPALVPCAALVVLGCVAFAARAAENAPAAADGWHTASPPDGSFQVRAPVALQAFVQQDDESATKARTDGVRATQAAAFDGVIKYVASCTVQPGAAARSASARLEEMLATWKKQADFLYRRPVRSGKLDGFEFEIADPQKTLRVRVFATPSRECTALVQWNHYAKPREDEIVGFLDSFTLKKP